MKKLMRARAISVLFIFVLLSILMIPIRAQDVSLWVNLDKVQYEIGQQGTISIIIRNTSDDPIEVRNVSIQFTNWMMYTVDGWDELGNQTIFLSPFIIINANDVVALDDISFTVPTDGRGTSTYVDVWIYTNNARIHAGSRIDVFTPYTQTYLETLKNISDLLGNLNHSEVIWKQLNQTIIQLQGDLDSLQQKYDLLVADRDILQNQIGWSMAIIVILIVAMVTSLFIVSRTRGGARKGIG